ncbi:MAG TPA: DinB family protein [Micromonosporaceae bacterium]|nr:DinB family protein [Micromonosporaceae bacterium]
MSEAERVNQPTTTRWTRSTIYADMWVDPDDDPRESGTATSDERGTLVDYLRRYRLTLEMKCADLDAEQLARRSVPPSTMSLLGLVRHMADVERHWFRRALAGQDAPNRYHSKEDRDGDWDGAVADPAVVDDAWQAWRSEVAFAEQFVADSTDLGARGATGVPLRDVLVHMIEEYARHCGHADLLRECIDGRVGQ